MGDEGRCVWAILIELMQNTIACYINNENWFGYGKQKKL